MLLKNVSEVQERYKPRVWIQIWSKSDKKKLIKLLSYRKEGKDQKSLQLPNTFRPRHQRERRMH